MVPSACNWLMPYIIFPMPYIPAAAPTPPAKTATTSFPVADKPNIPVKPNIIIATDKPWTLRISNAPPPASISRPMASVTPPRTSPTIMRSIIMKKRIPPRTAQLTKMISMSEGASIPTNSVIISNKVMAQDSSQSLIVFSSNLA